jgi:hypothetical protein
MAAPVKVAAATLRHHGRKMKNWKDKDGPRRNLAIASI